MSSFEMIHLIQQIIMDKKIDRNTSRHICTGKNLKFTNLIIKDH